MDLSKALLIAVDVQNNLLGSFCAARAVQFMEDIRCTADAFADYGVETLWPVVPACLDKGEFYSSEDPRNLWHKAKKELSTFKINKGDGTIFPEFGLPDLHHYETIYIKNHNSVMETESQDAKDNVWFSRHGIMQIGPHKNLLLPHQLKRSGYDTLLFAGRDTSRCVGDSVRDALHHDFKVCVLLDLLGDASRNNAEEWDADKAEILSHNLDLLKEVLGDDFSKVEVRNSCDVLEELKAQPALPDITVRPLARRIFCNL